MMFEKYDAYKDSGVEWLGTIPSNWDIFSLKRSIDGCFNGLWGSDPKENNDDIVVLRVADFDRNKLVIDNSKLTVRNIKKSEIGNRLLKKGDLLIEKSGGGDKTLVGCVVLFNENYKALTSNFVAKMTPKSNVNSYFLNYFFAALYANNINYQSIKQTTGIQNLDTNSYLNEKLALPSLHEQEAIVSFLNQKTSEIDQAIAIKEQQIALLNERKQIVIQKAVTQGLDPNVPMKDSGVEWIGEIPKHWEARVNRTMFKERNEQGKEGLPLLSVSIHSGVSNEEISEEDNVRGRVKIEDKSKYILVKKGDIAFNMMRAWQGGIGAVSVDGMVSPAYIVAKPNHLINSDFFEYQYRCPEFIQQMDRYSKGITDFRKRLYWDGFKQLVTVVPPLDEQLKIVEQIKAIEQQTNFAIQIKNQQIAKLKEYKTTLINDAVTGKIKVA
ncbi:restriction endonuclease subunit S [Acinetobacter baumannii]|nr:restriction endonuclease subunit S [Acinetobacter baumannii]MDC4285730.1 restriction endonuclease subunit S [Acinetobacter baumannii]MDC4289528.1 restriction endonuclease subunit S [Acinetobacter baumannii]MDC4321521.1 restriction endonuclease subunit S [Acinetobacter baumannii]